MKRKLILTILIVSTIPLSYSQECSCEDNLNWLIETFEKNDAGFQYVIKEKGKQAYKNHNEIFRMKAKSATSDPECHPLLMDWPKFFRNGHFSIQYQKANNNGNSQSNLTDKELIEIYKDEEKYEITIEAFSKYISNLDGKLGFEGVWQNGNYKIGIIKDSKSNEEKYIGFIIEADGIYWHKNQIKLKIQHLNGSNNLIAKYYMQNHSENVFEDIELLGNNILKIGWITWRRIEPKIDTTADVEIENYLELINSSNPIVEKISDSSVLLRIPSFAFQNKKMIDSIINANHNLIVSHENLIIDIRNNGGGSDNSYAKIIPYIYTNPIRTVGVEFLSTPLNNSRMQMFIDDPNWSDEDKKWAKKGLNKLENNLDEFVNLNDDIVSVEKLDTVYTYPKNVAILINWYNGSTSEQFLLAAKQSKKVKLFGNTTQGVLDISNMHFVDFPCKDYKLGYSLSKSFRIPEMTIDSKGIQPDYYIDKSIPKYKWIDFVEKILNKE